MMKFAIMLLLLAGCTLVPKKTIPVAVYDFGPPASVEQHTPISIDHSILVTDILAPVWLDNQTIAYRLAYHDPARIYAYANSRWAASPAKLLTQRLKHKLSTHTRNGIVSSRDGLKADYALLIELEEFTHVFDQPEQSRAVIHLRASLIERSTRQLLAQNPFTIERNTPSADAAGAVATLISASDAMAAALIDWLIEHLTLKASHGNQ